jgi:predicted aconitase with swiveling domain/8-oxo-dGTP pyrophosphatase MutT (NUDIX family)
MRIRGRGIVPGQASGNALVSSAPFSFVGGVDPATGSILDGANGSAGERLGGRVFVFPSGKGSTVGSYVLYGLGKRGQGPVAIVNRRADAVVAVGATLAGIPMVDRVDVEGLHTGDRIVVDGSRGTVELPDIRARRVVTAILRNRGRILIVRRSEKVGTFRGKWSAISGHIEGREDPKRRAIVEVREETGIRAITFRGAGDPVLARDGTTIYVVHPFLFDTSNRQVRLDWENVEHRWVRPEELERFESVPRLVDVVAAVLQPSA